MENEVSIDIDLSNEYTDRYNGDFPTHRAKGELSHIWIEGIYSTCNNKHYIVNRNGSYKVDKKTICSRMRNGFPDRDGVAIYHNDIVEVSNLPINTPGRYRIKDEHNSGFYVRVVNRDQYKKYRLPAPRYIKIVGNVIDDADILTPLEAYV